MTGQAAYAHGQGESGGNGCAANRFPLLRGGEAENRLAYLDSAATSQVPDTVLEAQIRFETAARANIHRGLYPLAEEASDAYEHAREAVASFFDAEPETTVFTHGATEALNLAVFGWAAENLKRGDTVLVDTANHHANIVPWHMLADRLGIELAFIGVDETGGIDRNRWLALLERKPKAAALCHVSNVTGFEADLATLTREAHRAGAVVIADCAQAAGHTDLAIRKTGVDFAAVSAHKMYGPFGIGALFISPDRIESTKPLMGGGGMIERVDEEGFSYQSSPACFEAGTPNITGAIGFAAACSFVDEVGGDALKSFSTSLCDRAIGALAAIDGVEIVGKTALGMRSSIVSFCSPLVHPHDLAASLAEDGIAVRAGHHCAMPLHCALGIPASVRASFGAYSDHSHIDRLVAGVAKAMEVFNRE